MTAELKLLEVDAGLIGLVELALDPLLKAFGERVNCLD